MELSKGYSIYRWPRSKSIGLSRLEISTIWLLFRLEWWKRVRNVALKKKSATTVRSLLCLKGHGSCVLEKDYKAKGNWHNDFSGDPLVRNLPASAGDMGLIPGPGGSCMLQSNSAHEPQLLKSMLLEPVLQSKRNHHKERPLHHNKEKLPLIATRECTCTAEKTQCSL